MPRLHLIATGGTISTVASTRPGAAVPGLHASSLLATLPAPGPPGTEISVEDLGRQLSSEMSLDDVFTLARRIRSVLIDSPDLAAVVVSHGTGTMEETSFLTHLLLPDDRPVVFTGAMRGTSPPYADGPGNLWDALRVAVDPASVGLGALIVMAGEIHGAGDAVKAHTIAYAAFRSGGYGPLGSADPDRVTYARRPAHRLRLPTEQFVPEVDLIRFVVGMDDRFVEASLAHGVRGLVVEGSGLGNLNAPLADGVVRALRRGVVVAVCSRAAGGRVFGAYGTPAAASRLADEGCILSSLPGTKTRMLLMAALGAGMENEEIAALLDPP